MPELPEVETVRRVLEPQLKNRTMVSLAVHHSQVLANLAKDEFCEAIKGQTIAGMSRRGKFLTIHMASGDRMVLHLRMTGSLLITPAEYEREKHTHLVFVLDNGQEIHFTDMRRFGRFWWLRKGEEDTVTGISRLGLEPFDEKLTADYLKGKWSKRRKAIKECLLEQNVVAGIGNIYSDEILFRVGIHPARKAVTLTAEEWERLTEEIPRAMRYYIDKNAISPEDYLAGKGDDYRNTPYLQVYDHEGATCPRCGSTLCRMVIGGRSSVYCPECQI